MPLPGQASPAARTALMYITLGSLVLVWAGIWYSYLNNQEAGTVPASRWYICYGLLLTGAVVLIIGLAVGQIGRSARHAEVPAPPLSEKEAATAPPAVHPQTLPNGQPIIAVPSQGMTGAQVAAAGQPVIPLPTTPPAAPAAPVAQPAPKR